MADEYERRPDHPLNMARALHTSCISTAPVVMEQLMTLNIIAAPKTKAEYMTLLEGVTQALKNTYPEAIRKQGEV